MEKLTVIDRAPTALTLQLGTAGRVERYIGRTLMNLYVTAINRESGPAESTELPSHSGLLLHTLKHPVHETNSRHSRH